MSRRLSCVRMCASGPNLSEFLRDERCEPTNEKASNRLAGKEAKMRSQRIERGALPINSSGKNESELSRQSAVLLPETDNTDSRAGHGRWHDERSFGKNRTPDSAVKRTVASCPPRTCLLPRSPLITLANTYSTEKPFGNQFLTQKSHFPTAPRSSRDNNERQCSGGASAVHMTPPVLFRKPLVAATELQAEGLIRDAPA
jgi:hypothetical protein